MHGAHHARHQGSPAPCTSSATRPPYISLHLPASPCISLHLPASPCIPQARSVHVFGYSVGLGGDEGGPPGRGMPDHSQAALHTHSS